MEAKTVEEVQDYGPAAFIEWIVQQVNADGAASDAEVARMTGIAQSNLNRYRSGLTKPSFEILRRVCSELNLPILVALVKAGLVTEEESGIKFFKASLREATTDELFEELRARVA